MLFKIAWIPLPQTPTHLGYWMSLQDFTRKTRSMRMNLSRLNENIMAEFESGWQTSFNKTPNKNDFNQEKHQAGRKANILLRMVAFSPSGGFVHCILCSVSATTDDGTATTVTTTFYSVTKQHTISKQSCGSHSSHRHPPPAGQTSLPLCFTQQELLDWLLTNCISHTSSSSSETYGMCQPLWLSQCPATWYWLVH